MTQPLSYGLAGSAAYTGYYKHSGRVTFAGVAETAAVGLPAAVVAGVVYAFGDIFVPLVYLKVLMAMGFGTGMGALCGAVLRQGKVRNVPVSLATIGVLTAVAYYVSWVAWICVTLDHTYKVGRNFTAADVVLHPKFMGHLIIKINEVGTWTISRPTSSPSSRPTTNAHGVELAVVWLAEAVVIFGGAFVVGRRFASDLPFCEACDRWAAKPFTITRVGVGDPATARATVEGGRYDYLAALRGHETPSRWWTVEHHQCMGCKQFHVVRVNDVTRTVDKNGRESDKVTAVVPRIVVTSEQLAALKAAFGLGGYAAAAAAEPPPTPEEFPTITA